MTERTEIDSLSRKRIEASSWWPLYCDFRRIVRKHAQIRRGGIPCDESIDTIIMNDGFKIFAKFRKLVAHDIETRHLIEDPKQNG
jgi:hypothetical protein